MAGVTDHAREIRLALKEPTGLCSALGLMKGATRQAGGVIVCCPAHADRTPSCSVRIGPDGTIAVKCHGCGFSGDALSLIAKVHGFSVKGQFKEVLLAAAELAGLHTVLDELNGHKPYEKRDLPPPAQLPPERVYPPISEVAALWAGCGPVTKDAAATRHLAERKLNPSEVERFDLARVITNQRLPHWASYQSGSWRSSGHRMIVPVYDSEGDMRSVRAWRIEGDAQAKRLPPSGCKATGLVMANARAAALLRAAGAPCRVLCVEGEPDYVTASIRWPWFPVFGLISGSWGPAFAERIPYGSEMVVATHHDPAGDKYAEIVKTTLKSRALVIRSAA